MITVKLDKLMILSDELRCISYLQCLLDGECDEELKDCHSTAKIANSYLIEQNKK